MGTRKACLLSVLALLVLFPISGNAATDPPQADDEAEIISNMKIEDLMNVVVSSVSKKEQLLADAPSAIYVITQADIKNSGVTSIPDALRMAPGLHVARIDAHSWAITSRGFNGLFANKLLVLIDGRSIYSPLSAGINWDEQDTVLEDIERIEVIRGPGATLWGANAVNGVINIITKDSADTIGLLASGGGGSLEKSFGSIRYGTSLGQDATVRLYSKYFNRDSLSVIGNSGVDGWDVLRGGGRIDWHPTGQDLLTVQGDLYTGTEGMELLAPAMSGAGMENSGQVPGGGAPYSITKGSTSFSGGNMLLKYRRTIFETSDLTLQLYYDQAGRSNSSETERSKTADIDLLHRFRPWKRHEIVWGIGYRFFHNNYTNSNDKSASTNDYNLYNALVQDDITLFEDRLHLIVGAKLEHNDYTGVEFQPSARLLWTPDQRHSLWASVSRAVRTPSLQETVLRVNTGPNTVYVGTSNFKSEELLAYELGYRIAVSKTSSLDFAAFYNNYEKLSVMNSNSDGADSTTQMGSVNGMQAQSYGLELAAEWRPSNWLTVVGNYTYFRLNAQSPVSSTAAAALEASAPRHQASLRTTADLGYGVSLNLWGRFVDKVQTSFSNGQGSSIPAYTTLDARLAWKPTPAIEIALVGQNLLQPRHKEYQSAMSGALFELQRTVYGKITWQF